MQTIKAVVNGSDISIEKLDELNLSTGEKVMLSVAFGPEWNGMAKVVQFNDPWGSEHPPQILTDGYRCAIPVSVFNYEYFVFQVHGLDADGNTISTQPARFSYYRR